MTNGGKNDCVKLGAIFSKGSFSKSMFQNGVSRNPHFLAIVTVAPGHGGEGFPIWVKEGCKSNGAYQKSLETESEYQKLFRFVNIYTNKR